MFVSHSLTIPSCTLLYASAINFNIFTQKSYFALSTIFFNLFFLNKFFLGVNYALYAIDMKKIINLI